MGIPDHLTRLLRNCMWVKKQLLELCMKQLIGSRERSTTGLSAVTLFV